VVRAKAVYQQTAVQLCLVHMVRHCLNSVSWKMRKVVAADLKTIYSAATADEAVLRLEEFADQWDQDYPTIVKSWGDESREGAVIQVLDKSTPTERKSKPKKALLAIIATLAAGLPC
jgi:transposase-like protein